MLVLKIVSRKECFGPKKLDQKSWVAKNWVQTKFVFQKYVGAKILWVQKNIGPQKCWSNNILVQEKFSPKNCGSEKNVGPKLGVETNFGSKEIFVKKLDPKQIWVKQIQCRRWVAGWLGGWLAESPIDYSTTSLSILQAEIFS